jgi:hypothetical protein
MPSFLCLQFSMSKDPKSKDEKATAKGKTDSDVIYKYDEEHVRLIRDQLEKGAPYVMPHTFEGCAGLAKLITCFFVGDRVNFFKNVQISALAAMKMVPSPLPSPPPPISLLFSSPFLFPTVEARYHWCGGRPQE